MKELKKTKEQKKSQAAIEFLATYGWAFLIILIVIGALSYFGILSPSKLLPDRCNFGAEFGCVDYGIGSNGILLKLRNGIGNSIYVDSVSASTEKSQLACTFGISGILWGKGEVKNIPIGCSFSNSDIIQGDKGKINLKITYHDAKSSASFGKEVQGEIYTTVKSANAIPASCKETLDNGLSVGDGIYTIFPAGSAVNVYCDMTTDGGGWTLVARTGASCTSNFGWNYAAGSVNDFNLCYSLGAGNLNLAFTELLFGQKLNENKWGDYVYKTNVPPNFLAAYSNSMGPCSYPIPVKGGNTQAGMQNCKGFTHKNNLFYFRDCCDQGSTVGVNLGLSGTNFLSVYCGFTPSDWQWTYSGHFCSQENDKAMIFVR